MYKIKNIFWDWNGTIVNDAYLFVDIMNITLSKFGLQNITINDYRKNFCFPIQKYWKSLGFQFDDNAFNKMNVEFIQLYKKNMYQPPLHVGIKKVFQFAKKKSIKQFVLSASENIILNSTVKSYGIDHFFTDIVGVDNLNAVGKERLAVSLIKKHNLNPCQTLVIGDTTYDGSVAKKIKANLLLLSCGHFTKQRLLAYHDDVIDDISHIKRFLF